MLRCICSCWMVLCVTASLFAQGTQADYERAAALAERYTGKALNARPTLSWYQDGQQFVYRQQRGDGKSTFWKVDVRTGTRTEAFDHERLAAELTILLKRPIEAQRLPFTEIEVGNDTALIYFRIDGTRWQYDRYAGQFKRQPSPNQPTNTRFTGGRTRRDSPDGLWRVIIKNNNAVLVNQKSKEEHPLTKDGTAEIPYIEQFYWSPNSKKLVLQRVKPAQEHKVYLIESSPRDQLQPRLHEMNYLKPGDTLAQPQLALVDLLTRQVIPIVNKQFPNPYSLTMMNWTKDSSRFTFLYNQRGHQALKLLAMDADTGFVQPIINETSPTFIDYAGKFFLHNVEGRHEAIWMSERDGWNHLYLYDTQKLQVKKQLTQGPWVIRKVVKVDDANRQLWFTCGGFYAEQEPYQLHLGRVNYDGSGLTILTSSDANHATELSPTGEYFIDYASRVDLPTATEVRSAHDGKLLVEVERADITALQAAGWKAPERFVAKARDGQTNIYGLIHRPSNFTPTKRYPVIEYIYAGPQDAYVPKDFRPYYRLQTIADLGFIVVQMDGMGTSYRSKAFHDVCWKNLGDAGFPDRIAWIKAAAARYSYMDLSRVGIYGGSAGGQNTLRGMLIYPEFYKVGVADCGCHDNRMDKIWWNELWMGWPIGPHYAEQSNVTQAHRLQGKLLLTVGELDRNVDPTSTMQVVNALIKANKDFDLLVVPGGGHGVGESPYMARRRQDFFVRHLLGVEPRQ